MITWWNQLTEKNRLKSWIDLLIESLADIDQKYQIFDEIKKRQIDLILNKIQEILLRNYPSEDYELSQEVVIKPYWALRPFISKHSVVHIEIKKLVLFLRVCRKKFLDRSISEGERERIQNLIRYLSRDIISEINGIINS